MSWEFFFHSKKPYYIILKGNATKSMTHIEYFLSVYWIYVRKLNYYQNQTEIPLIMKMKIKQTVVFCTKNGSVSCVSSTDRNHSSNSSGHGSLEPSEVFDICF